MRYVACVMISAVMVGCAGRGVPTTRSAEPSRHAGTSAKGSGSSLESFMAKMRQLSVEARPERPQVVTLEASDQRLGAALAAATLSPSPEAYRAVAEEYRRLGVFDRAHANFNKALALTPQDPATFDALARLWRDAGFPHLALGDAHRAVYFAPGSAVARNTLGTVLQALGRRELARKEYERAVELDPAAAYAFNNLCYAWVLEGQAAKAVAACERALAADRTLTVASNNLALAHAVAGNATAARNAFAAGSDAAGAVYNMGIVFLARQQYDSAVRAFQEAHALRPTMTMALARAKQAAQTRTRSEE